MDRAKSEQVLPNFRWPTNREFRYREGYRYKKAEVALRDIVPEDSLSGYLFEDIEETEEKQSLMKAVDSLKTRFGDGAPGYGSTGIYRSWEMRRGKLTFSISSQSLSRTQ
jgi:DNA polymerase V